MDETRGPSEQRDRSNRSLTGHLGSMPRWHKIVLSLALLASAVGAAGWVAGQVAERAADAEIQAAPQAVPAPGTSQLLPRTSDPAAPQHIQPQPAADQPLALQLSPQMMRIGVSLLVGFMVGFLFRMFVKTMALIVLVIGGLLLALTYFNVVNVDLTMAQQTYDSSREWLSDQALRLRDVVLAHIPSSASGAVGAFMGFRRK